MKPRGVEFAKEAFLVVRFWNRSRWFAYGTLASLAVSALLVVIAATVLLTAIGSAIKG